MSAAALELAARTAIISGPVLHRRGCQHPIISEYSPTPSLSGQPLVPTPIHPRQAREASTWQHRGVMSLTCIQGTYTTCDFILSSLVSPSHLIISIYIPPRTVTLRGIFNCQETRSTNQPSCPGPFHLYPLSRLPERCIRGAQFAMQS